MSKEIKKALIGLISVFLIAVLFFVFAFKLFSMLYFPLFLTCYTPCNEVSEPIDFDLTIEKQDAVLTHYCSCEKCCGRNTGITASGNIAKEKHTIAGNKNIPFGSMVYDKEKDILYTVEDRGGAIKGNKFDVFVNSHEEALKRGIENKEIYLIKVSDWKKVNDGTEKEKEEIKKYLKKVL